MVIQRELFFLIEEYHQRLAALREKMVAREIDALLLAAPENLYYVTGYQTFGFHNYQLLCVPIESEPFLILRNLESYLVQRYAWIDDVVGWDDTDDPIAITVEALRAHNLLGKRIGIEERSFFLRVCHWRALNEKINTVVDGSGLVEKCRARKSPREVEYMREAARMTDLGMQAAIQEIQAGKSENDVAAGAFDTMTRAGAEYLTRDPIVTSGDRAGIPHTCYYRRQLQDGDSVLLEMSGVYNRYYSPLMRGVVIGGANPKLERLADACIEGLNAAIEAVRPGATSGEVDEACRSVIEREGLWEYFRKRTGYSVGIGFSSWGEGGIVSLEKDDPSVLEPGMCFHMPPAVRLYGEAGLGFSETVHVTETGCEVLGKTPRELVYR